MIEVRKTNFAKLNTEALFNAVDYDKSGEITQDEWLAFWEIVKKSGHTEEEIEEEVTYSPNIFAQMDSLLEGKAWVGFRKVDEFLKKDRQENKNEVGQIVKRESKFLTMQHSKIEAIGQEKQEGKQEIDLNKDKKD